jgi:Tol biopolymer transport system component
MQSDKPQGDLITWQPDTENIAYIAPAERTSWYTGDLMYAKGPDFAEKIYLAPNVLANGDLTWSPEGSLLAFLAYRPNEGLYTVMVVRPDGSGLMDLFPSDMARTDTRSSQKAILGWRDEDTLEVISSCGEECRLAYAVQVSDASGPALTPTPLSNYHELTANLQMHRLVKDFDARKFPKSLSDESSNPMPNWSPDETMIAYLDRRGLLWLLITKEQISYLLDVGLRDVYETQWGSASDHIAIRAEDRIFVFQVPCREEGK